MGLTIREKYVERLNQHVEEHTYKLLERDVENIQDDVRGQVLKQVQDGSRPSQILVARAINDLGVPNTLLTETAINTWLTAQVNLLFMSRKTSDLVNGQLIRGIINRSPKTTAKNIKVISKSIANDYKTGKAYEISTSYSRLKDIISENEFKEVKRLVDDYRTKIKNDIGESVRNDIRRTVNTMKRNGMNITDINTFDTSTELDTRKEYERIAKKFTNKSPEAIQSMTRDSIHSALEEEKYNQASENGYRFKSWITQGDTRVRSTHKKVNNQKVRINEMFKVGNKHKALYPQDRVNLPIGEWIRCRCFLKYSKL